MPLSRVPLIVLLSNALYWLGILYLSESSLLKLTLSLELNYNSMSKPLLLALAMKVVSNNSSMSARPGTSFTKHLLIKCLRADEKFLVLGNVGLGLLTISNNAFVGVNFLYGRLPVANS